VLASVPAIKATPAAEAASEVPPENTAPTIQPTTRRQAPTMTNVCAVFKQLAQARWRHYGEGKDYQGKLT